MLEQSGEGEPGLPRVRDLPAGVRLTSLAMKISSGYDGIREELSALC